MFCYDSKLRLMLIYLIFAARVTSETKITSVVKLTDTNVELKLLNTTIYSVSLGSCALNCRSSPQLCCSFYYTKVGQSCSFGLWLFPGKFPRASIADLYSLGTFCDTTGSASVCPNNNNVDCGSSSGSSFQVKSQFDLNKATNFCNTTANFTLMTNGSTTACVWMSQIYSNYTAAKVTCENKNGNLFTLRTNEKASIFSSIFQSEPDLYWIGLDDVEEDGVFKWIDDGSVMENASLPIPFLDDVSFEYLNNNAGFDDCVFYNFKSYYGGRLSKIDCDLHLKFVCEMYPRCN